MDEKNNLSLHERVNRLERTVRELKNSLDLLNARLAQKKQVSETTESRKAIPSIKPEPKQFGIARPGTPEPESTHPEPKQPSPPPPRPARPSRKLFKLPEHMRKSEYWLNKAGIGLILFAVVFLFKYSIDQGWLNPPIRIVFGLALGTALLIIGIRIYGRRRHFSQVLIGGAIATYYITGFAAFQMFSLISYPVALSFMIAVTLLAFLVSLMQDEAVLSLIGTLGGLGTPFLLYSGAGSMPGLIIYTSLVLAGTSAIYFYRGWCSLLWLSTMGGWIIFLIGLTQGILPISHPSITDRWALQSGVLFGWFLFWAVPIIREVASAGNLSRWRSTMIGFGDKSISQDIKIVLDYHVFLATVIVAFVTLSISKATWPTLSDSHWGWITMGGAAVYGVVFWNLNRREQFKNLALTHAIMGLVFFTIALSLLLEGDALILALAAEGAALHLVARQVNKKAIAIFAHVLFGMICLWLGDRLHLTQIGRLIEPYEGTAILNARALTDLVVVGFGFLMSVRLRMFFEKRIYFIISFAALAAWLCRELDGNILFVSLIAEAVIVHLIGRFKSDRVVAGAAHIFWGALGLWLIVRLFNPRIDETAMLNAHALINFLFIVVTLGLSKLYKLAREADLYRLFAHITFLGWFLSELAPIDNGQGYVTIAWGSYAAVLLVAGLMKDYRQLRNVAIITLFVVVGKLFLVDLANLEVLWRILLFMGFGGLFLFLSYYFQDLWKLKSSDKTD